MKKILLALVLLVSMLFNSVPVAAKDAALIEQVKNAVAILYSQNESGGMRMHCTVTAFEKLETVNEKTKVKAIVGYRYATAAHCIGPDDRGKERAADTKTTQFFISYDETPVKKFYAATPIFVGYQSRGEDLAEFEVKTSESWPVIALGDEKKSKDGDDVISVSVPMGLGKLVLIGTISKVFIDRPIVVDDINWRGSIALSIGGINGGSSGSAIVSEDQDAIVGILVGTIGGTTITAIPISKFKAVRAAVAAGKYKYYQPVVELNPDGSKVE